MAPPSSSPSVSTFAPQVKSSPRVPVCPVASGCPNAAKAKSLPSSPAPSLRPAQPETPRGKPESTSPPPQERSAQPYARGPPLDHGHIRRSERHSKGRAQDMPPKVEGTSAPRDPSLGSQMYEGASRVGSREGPRDDPRPVQPGGGYRDGPPRGKEEPAKLGSRKHAHSLSRKGDKRESSLRCSNSWRL